MEDAVGFLDGYYRRSDANDLLACYGHGSTPISAQMIDSKGDFAKALRAIRAQPSDLQRLDIFSCE